MIRAPAFALVLAFTTAVPALAQTTAAQDQATVEVAPAPEVKIDPAKKRAEEIDRVFAQLQNKDSTNPGNMIAKIWTLWEANDSPMAEVLLAQSAKAMQDGAFDTSETMLNELVGSYPDYTEALNKRAMLLYNLKRYDEAMTDINAVLDAEPRHFGALSGKAAILQAQGNTAQAAEALREAIAVNPHLQTAKDVLQQLEHDYPTL
jgi:tetratricopeptide (TPR) repeat protein